MSPSLDSPARQTRSVDSVKVAEKDMRISFRVSHFPHISHLVSHASHTVGRSYLALWVSPFPHPQFVSPSLSAFCSALSTLYTACSAHAALSGHCTYRARVVESTCVRRMASHCPEREIIGHVTFQRPHCTHAWLFSVRGKEAGRLSGSFRRYLALFLG